MGEKKAIIEHYGILLNEIFTIKSSCLLPIQQHLCLIYAQLAQQSGWNPLKNCPGCFIARSDENHLVFQIPPLDKNKRKRMKQIQKIRKNKHKSKQQENMLKKLLNRKNGCIELLCTLCKYSVKLPKSSESVPSSTNKIKSIQDQTNQKLEALTKVVVKKRKRDFTAGLNPLYVKTNERKERFNDKSLTTSSNVEKLSKMIQISENKEKTLNKLNIFLTS